MHQFIQIYALFYTLGKFFSFKFDVMKKLFLFIFFSLLLAGFAGGFYLKKRLETPSMNKNPIILEIPIGSSPAKVSQILHENKVWNDPDMFRLWCRVKKCALKAGWFEIPPQQNLEELIAIFESGKNAVRKVTIPEGRASWEMPFYIKKEYPELDAAVWDSLVQDAKFARSLGVNASSLEGYLFPETYLLPFKSDEETIIKTMVAANLKLRDELQSQGASVWKKLGGWHQILTLASVVEEETGNTSERTIIAGVFHNRLDLGMPLGADPTVRFIFKNLTGPIYKSQLNSDSPYNTRKFAGLMPGPISNPGRQAIEAVLNPEKTDKLYFVAKDDGSGTHFFGSTLIEHNRFKDSAAQNRLRH